MNVHFTPGEGGVRWAWTEGLTALGQAEIAVPLTWPEDQVRDHQIVRLLEFVKHYVTKQPKRILPNQTLTYGWTTLRFAQQKIPSLPGGADWLVVSELGEPFGSDPGAFIAGAEQAIGLLQAQEDALRRNRITGHAEHPHRFHRAVVCTEVMRRDGSLTEPLVLLRSREPDNSTHDSGWYVGCNRPDHNHDDPDELEFIHLLHVVQIFPTTLAYLAMPVQTMVVISDAEIVFFPPGSDAGVLDPICEGTK